MKKMYSFTTYAATLAVSCAKSHSAKKILLLVKPRLLPSIKSSLLFSFFLFALLGLSSSGFGQTWTPYFNPTANSNSGVTSPQYAYTSDNSRAVFDNANDIVQYSNFSIIGIPADATIRGIEVSIEGYCNNPRELDVSLSWNYSTYTGVKTTSLGDTEGYNTLGGSTDGWGRSWTVSELGNTNFRIKLDATFYTWGGDLLVDHVRVRVSYVCNSVPAQPSAITGSTAPCQGSSQTYSVTNVAGVNYTWGLPTGWSINSGQGTNSVNVTVVGSGTGNITVTPSNPCDQNGTARTLAVSPITVPAQPSAITGSTAPCQGSSQIYSVTNVPGVTYTWTFPSGWSQTGGGTTNSVTVSVGFGSGEVRVVPSNGSCDGTVRTLPVSSSPVPSQPSDILGSSNPCQGSSQTYSVTNVSGVTYTWTFPAGWAQTGGGTSNSVIVTAGSGSGNVQVIPSNGFCDGTARTLSVTVNKTGATLDCPIDIGTLGCTPYTDTQNNSPANGFGNDYTGANNQASDDIFYRFTLSAPSTVEISTCASPFDSYLHLLDASGVLISENDNPGPVCQNGGAASIRQIDLAAGNYYVVVEGWSTEAGDIPLTISLLPSGITAADNYSVCSGSDVTFTYTSSGGWNFSNFQYQMDGTAGTWTDWTGTSPYTWTADNPGHTFFVRAKANNGSCDSYTYPILVFVNPSSGSAPAITATPATINPGETVTLSVSDASLGVYYKFVSDINDYSPNGLHLTGPTPTFSDGGLALSEGTSFNSGTTSVLNTNYYTISFSMKMTADVGVIAKQLFAFAPAGYNRSPGIWFVNNKFYWRENSTTLPPEDLGVDLYTGVAPFVLGTWYDITGEKKGNTFTLYINGVQVATGTVPDPKAPGDAVLHFGGASVVIKEFKIYQGTVRWYSGSCGGTPEGSGLSITKTPLSSVTYFVRSENSCYNSDCSSWSVSANWLGGASGDVNNWNNTLNWFGGVIPVAGTDVIIPSGVDQPVISASTEAQCNNLTINPGASLTIQSSLASSGSLIVRGSSTGNVTYERQFKDYPDWGTNNNFDWHYFSSPVGSNSDANAAKVSAVYSYDEVTDTWPVASMTALTSGRGYNLDQAAQSSSDELLTFTGNVVRSAFSIGATSPYSTSFDGTSYTGRPFASGRNIDALYGGGGWNLLGNPFTSALDVSAFIDSNNGENAVASDGFFDPNYEALYVYDGSIGDNGTYVIYNTGAIQTGQGFFVLAMNNGVSFSFTPADASGLNMQVHNMSTALLKSAKAEIPWPGLELKVKYGSNESSTSILYDDSMTPGLDPGYDVGQLSAGPAVEIYTSLAAKDNGVNFARQALPIAGADTLVVAVGIDSEEGGEVTFLATTVPLGNNKFWLEDRKTGTFTDLSTRSYTVTLPAKTYGTGRFYLKSGTTITDVKPPKEESGLRIWTSAGKVIIKGDVSEKARCEIYNVNGRKIVDARLTGGELNTIDMPSGSNGVYIVRVTDGMKVTTRKVALL